MAEAKKLTDPVRIEIEVGTSDLYPDDPKTHKVIIDGRDVGLQVRKIEFSVEGGEYADVTVTYARPHLTVVGLAQANESRL